VTDLVNALTFGPSGGATITATLLSLVWDRDCGTSGAAERDGPREAVVRDVFCGGRRTRGGSRIAPSRQYRSSAPDPREANAHDSPRRPHRTTRAKQRRSGTGCAVDHRARVRRTRPHRPAVPFHLQGQPCPSSWPPGCSSQAVALNDCHCRRHDTVQITTSGPTTGRREGRERGR